jgi:putative peptidoglycan binding protein
MKFSPTVPLALVLAAGMAVAAGAQTTPGTSDTKSTVIKPPIGSTQTQPGLNDNKSATSSTEMKTTEPKGKSAEMKAIEPKGKSAEMKTEPRAKRTAHLKATHPKRMAQMKATPKRFAKLQRGGAVEPTAQAQNFTPDQVRQAQEQLKSAGLYNGPTDGMMDPDTRAALARFQQQNGLRRTETLDQQTLARMNTGSNTGQTTGFGSSAPTGNQAPPAGAGGNTGQPINR